MVSSFQLGFNRNPLEQTKYATPGAMEQAGLEDLKAPWATTVLPAIWKNTETMGDIFKGASNITNLDYDAMQQNEQKLSLDELRAKYPHVQFNSAQYASTAKYMAERQSRIQDLEWLKEHSTVKTPGAMFLPELGSYLAKSFTDPLELGFMGVTALATAGIGTAFPKLASFTGTGLAYKMAGVSMPKNLVQAQLQSAYLPLSSRMTGRMVQGFAEEAFANALVEPWVATASKRLGDDYTAMDSLMNVFVGGLTGSVFHTVGGAVADPFTRMTTENKLKTAAEYIVLRANGEDGLMATAQNLSPATTLSAQDIFTAKNIDITEAADGQFIAKFADEQGLLRHRDGVVGRTPGDAIRNLQYLYATKLNDAVLFQQLNRAYGNVTPAKTAGLNTAPFANNSKLAAIKNTTTVRRGQTKVKLDFESPSDRVFYAVEKILSKTKNKNKGFNEITESREALMEAIKWITDNLGDTSEANIRAHAARVSKYITTHADKNFVESNPAKAIKIPAIIKTTDFDIQPEFMTAKAWKKRLTQQRDILLGDDKEAAINILGEIYKADRELYKARVASLKEARSNIQKLINTTEEQLKTFTKRDLIRKNIRDAINASSKRISSGQLDKLLFMLDVVTGDFSKYIEEQNISYVASKEEQAKIEKRLMQAVPVKRSVYEMLEDPLKFFKAPREQLLEKALTVSTDSLHGDVIDAVIDAKTGKYSLQTDLKLDIEDMSAQNTAMLDGLDVAISSNHLKDDTILYRGLSYPEVEAIFGADIKPGMIAQSKGFLSTSFDIDQADGFASMNQLDDGRRVLLEVRVPKGSNALDVDAAIALNHQNSLRYNLVEQLAQANTIDELEPPELDTFFDDTNDASFTFGVVEGEVILPRDLALKVLDVKQEGNYKKVVVTPDATLNNIYGSNVLRDNVDLFFNKVKEFSQNYTEKLNQLEVNTPEHRALANEAFFNGYILSDETISAYPELRIAKELTQEIPGTWLMQAINKDAVAQRIIGEYIQGYEKPEFFESDYGHRFVYSLGDGTFTSSPRLAIEKTGKAVLYDIGAGPRYRVDLSVNIPDSNFIQELLKWEPALQNAIGQGETVQWQVIQRMAIDAINWKNRKGETFLDFLDAMNLNSRGKLKKQIEYTRLIFAESDVSARIYPLKNVPSEIKAIGEIPLFKDMSPDMLDTIDAEAVYKAMVKGAINKVEDLQTDVIKLQKEFNQARKQVETKASAQNQLDTSKEKATTKIKESKTKLEKAKKELEKSKKDLDDKIKKINKKTEPYNTVIKGAVDVGTEGQYIVHLFQNADISTLIHETAHIFRRTVLDADMLEQAEAALGVKNGVWTVQNEEDFAVAFEKYLAEGKAPVKGLEAMFEAFKSWLTKIYMKLSQSPLEQEFSPELRKVFDELFAEERVRRAEQAGYGSESVTKQMYRNALTQHKDELTRINKAIKDSEAILKDDRALDQATFEQFRQEKLARIQSKLALLDTPDELNQDEIRDAMQEISHEVRKEEREYAEVAESQFQKNQEFKGEDITFYADELAKAESGLMAYAQTLGLSEEQIQLLLAEGLDDLNIIKLDEEATANEILEGALREFGECTRGEL